MHQNHIGAYIHRIYTQTKIYTETYIPHAHIIHTDCGPPAAEHHTHDHPCPPHPQRRQGHIAEVSKVSIRHGDRRMEARPFVYSKND